MRKNNKNVLQLDKYGFVIDVKNEEINKKYKVSFNLYDQIKKDVNNDNQYIIYKYKKSWYVQTDLKQKKQAI